MQLSLGLLRDVNWRRLGGRKIRVHGISTASGPSHSGWQPPLAEGSGLPEDAIQLRTVLAEFMGLFTPISTI